MGENRQCSVTFGLSMRMAGKALPVHVNNKLLPMLAGCSPTLGAVTGRAFCYLCDFLILFLNLQKIT